MDISTFPTAFREQFARLSKEQQKAWEDERNRALSDGIYLGTEVLGMDFQEIPHRALFDQFLKFQPGADLHFTTFDRFQEIYDSMATRDFQDLCGCGLYHSGDFELPGFKGLLYVGRQGTGRPAV